MYADRTQRGRMNPGGLAAAIGINALLVAGIITAAPKIMPPEIWDSLPTDHIPLPPPPPPPKPEERKPVETTQPQPLPQPHTPDPIIPLPQPRVPVIGTPELPPLPQPLDPIGSGTGGGGGTVALDPPKPAPVVVGAELRGGDLQPDYPADMRRLGQEGRVVVRVLVGTDGRVKAVEQVSSPSDSFFAATKRQALSRWRFRPATRDGEPYETWKTLSISFNLTD